MRVLTASIVDPVLSVTLHIHPGSGLFMPGNSIAVARDRIFVLKADTKGDIWSITLDK